MRKFIVISLLLAVCCSAFAVTKEEMEKARVISAKIYLRWANNGSDYLEKLDPSNISQLEGDLRDKEKANLKAFKQIPVPSGYESWTKDDGNRMRPMTKVRSISLRSYFARVLLRIPAHISLTPSPE